MSQTWWSAQARGVARLGESTAAVAHRAARIATIEGQAPPGYRLSGIAPGGQLVVIRTPDYMRATA